MLHVDCLADALRRTQEQLDQKNYYLYNPEYMYKKEEIIIISQSNCLGRLVSEAVLFTFLFGSGIMEIVRRGVMSDWRLELNEHMVEDLDDTTFYKVTFPEFWVVAYREKNDFYQKIKQYAEYCVERDNNGAEFLEGEKIQHFWHEHCDLCWEKALTDINRTFYVTDDMKHWICEQCFNDFKEKFNWQAKNNT